MFEFSPSHTSVREMQRQELLAKVARCRIAEVASQTQAAGSPTPATATRFTLVRSLVRHAIDALSPLAFGFGSR
jgi:hypothetical protein